MSKKINRIKSAVLSGMIAAMSVAGSFATVAPALTTNAAGSDNYAKLLQYSLYFYDANMCGSGAGTTSAMSWRSACHTGDEVNGGFHDAGDHAMFGLPQGYAASTLGWSYYEFKDAYDATGQGVHLKVITDYFCDFFKKSTKLSGDTVTNFLYQKGDGNVDHQYWGAPEKQEQEQGVRKMYWTSNSASDIAAEYAAALAVNYLNFGNSEDLKYAEALYDFSVKNNSIASDGPMGFYYYEPNCQDEQAWAAGWLYLATKNEKYKGDCASKQRDIGWVHSWNTVDLGAACVYAEITGDWSKVNSYVGSNANGSSYLCMDSWGSARYNCAMQMAALVATKNSSADYSAWCKGQMNYLTGDNPTGTCFITGFASNSSKNTHHRAASGYQGYDGEYGFHEGVKTYHPTAGKTLIGALAGGPADAGGKYEDVINNYETNEVAIDYNAGLVGAAAGLYSVYKTGSIDTSIVGVDKIYNSSVGPVVTQPTTASTTQSQPTQTQPTQTQPTQSQTQPTQTTQNPSTGGDKVLTPSDMTVGTEKGDDGEINNYAEFKPQGAKTATLYLKVKTNDTEVAGAFGTWTGKWEQEDFKANVSGGTATVTYTIPSNVGQTVKAMVFWPHGDGVEIEKIVLSSGSTPSVTQPTQSQPIQTQPTTASTTQQQQTQPTTQNPSTGSEKVLTPSDMKVGTEEGDDGGINNYAEFNPQGAKSVTLYIKVNTNDTEVAGAFGTWTGKWEQEDFKANVSNGIATVTYTVPSNVGQTVKAMVFWPHGNGAEIEKVVLNMGSVANTQPTTASTTRQTQPTTASTTQPTQPTTQSTQGGNNSGSYLWGDANCDGKLNMADATLIVQHCGNKDKYKLSEQGEKNADVDGSAGITGTDALAIQKRIAGIG